MYFQHSKTLFIPYMAMDGFFLLLTFFLGSIAIFFGLVIGAVCIFFFLAKIYIAVAVYDLYKDEFQHEIRENLISGQDKIDQQHDEDFF